MPSSPPPSDHPSRGFALLRRFRQAIRTGVLHAFPEMGQAGSRSSKVLHTDVIGPIEMHPPRVDTTALRRAGFVRWLGTTGSLLIMVGGWGAGALPVVNNTFWKFPPAEFMGRLLLSATALVFVGIGCLVAAWLALGYLALASPLFGAGRHRLHRWVTPSIMIQTFLAWVIPLVFTAPLFTQDIYSYIAQGTIAYRGLDPYSAGPVDLLGLGDPLARSVPLVWSHSPSPYGPVAIMVGEAIAALTGSSITTAVFAYRLVSIVGLVMCTWALVHLSRRCGVEPAAALWLGVLNPLSLLHLVGGIHNESFMLGLVLVGIELCLRSFDRRDHYRLHHKTGLSAAQSTLDPAVKPIAYFVLGVFCICAATMVKVTSIVALAFVWVALIRRWVTRWPWKPARWIVATGLMGGLTLIIIVGTSVASGLGLGWLFVQGGAAEIVSWMSLSTLLGLIASVIGALLGLGDQSTTLLTFTRGLGLLVAGGWMVRMMFATYRGRMHMLGAYGVGMMVMVFLFPVVHPWYVLWAVLPLSAWANRPAFRITVVVYSALLSFFLLPRGLSLPPRNVAETYVVALLGFLAIVAVTWLVVRILEVRNPAVSLRLRAPSELPGTLDRRV